MEIITIKLMSEATNHMQSFKNNNSSNVAVLPRFDLFGI